ncbi:hypothetical protein DW655_09730 [Lachnospiraceae bacterium AM23-2LB]|nr:hypothetical protein DW655_09730 [Lachnospiraceae bacterium AM23-2LB]RJW04420.1 hypothetical protein DW887_05210 [Lachnospiraceae bacterium AM40-2BH]
MILALVCKGKYASNRVISVIFSVILNLGEIPEPIRERITSVSEQETLTDWAKIAVQSASMEEFVKKISE